MKKSTGKSSRSRVRQSASATATATDITRILVGVRIEPRLVKVLKGLAELHDCALGELIEKVFWHAMEGGNAFADKSGRLSAETRQQIQNLKAVYGVNYTLEDLMRPRERRSSSGSGE